jgi:hypothetical protein
VGILYAVTPLLPDDEFITWLRKFGNELPEASTSRYPTVREIRDTLAQLDGYSFEASTGGMNWEAVIFESGRQDDRWAGEWADLIVTEYHGDDNIPLSCYFSKGPARLPVLIVQQLTPLCGPLVIMLDSCAIPLLITSETDIDRAIQAWEM